MFTTDLSIYVSLSGLGNWLYNCTSAAFDAAAVSLIPLVSSSVFSLLIVQLTGLSMSYDCWRLRFADEAMADEAMLSYPIIHTIH